MAPPAAVSVVIPCHNYGRFLEEAVASVEAQTRRPDEIVVIDDGSTDDTRTIAEALAARIPELRVVSRTPARGPAQTFNDGVRATTGELVVILSADDRMSPRYLERMEAAFTDADVGFAYADEHLFGAQEGVRRAPDFDADELMVENPYNGSGMFRRSLFDAAGGFRIDFDRLGLEDWEFWVHLVALGARGRRVDDCWLDYRRHVDGSRNTISRVTALRAHMKVWRLHADVMRVSHVVRWARRSVRRNLRRSAPS